MIRQDFNNLILCKVLMNECLGRQVSLLTEFKFIFSRLSFFLSHILKTL